MTLEDFFQSAFLTDFVTLSLGNITLVIIVPTVLGLIVAWVYRETQASNTYTVTFLHALVLFAALSASSTLIVGSNVARAFGLIGALSIIRFRNALKSPLDAIYIFWSLVIGMACGTGHFMVAIYLTIICSVIALGLSKTNFGHSETKQTMLRIITKPGDTDPEPLIESTLKPLTRTHTLLNTLTDTDTQERTYIYTLSPKPKTKDKDLLNALESLPKIKKILQLNNEPFVNLND